MDYKDYSVEDFILDDEFRDWVTHPKSTKALFWNNWILSHPLKRKQVAEAKKIVLLTQPKDHQVDQEVIEAGLSSLKSHFISETTQKRSHIFTPVRLLKLTAISILLVFIGSLLKVNYQPDILVYKTQSDEQKQIVLPEGSEVILNEQSRLTFFKNWRATHDRIVKLEGEAYFSVKKRHYQGKKAKFTVQTPDVSIEVLGTEFNVNTKEDLTRVVLNSGKIQLKTIAENQVVMHPGDVAEYFHNFRKLVVKSNTNHKEFIAWVDPVKNSIQKPVVSAHKISKTSSKVQQTNVPEFGLYSSFSLQNALFNKPLTLRPSLPATYNNLVYQEQIGNQNIFQAEQYGEKNIVTSKTAGNNNQVITEQEGKENKVDGIEKLHPSFALPQFGILQYGNFNQIQILQKGWYNEVQSHQIGSKNNAMLTQSGTGNIGITQQYGSGNEAYIEQIGENLRSRQIQIGSQNKAQSTFSGLNYRNESDDAEWSTYQEQVGLKNQSQLQVGNSSPNTNAYTMQYGKDNKAEGTLYEDYNYLFIYQEGEENTANTLTSEGNLNEVYIYQFGFQNEVGSPLTNGVTQKGNYNDVNIIQFGNQHSASTLQQGEHNQVQINQKNKK